MRAAWIGGWALAASLLGAPVVAAHEAPEGATEPAAPPRTASAAADDEPQRLLESARGAGRVGRSREALRALASLVRRHGESRWAGEAWLEVGDQHLGARDLTRARAAFKVARRSGDATVSEAAGARLALVEATVRDEAARLRPRADRSSGRAIRR